MHRFFAAIVVMIVLAGRFSQTKVNANLPTMAALAARWVGFDVSRDPRIVLDIAADGSFTLEDRHVKYGSSWVGQLNTDPQTQRVADQRVTLTSRANDGATATAVFQEFSGYGNDGKVILDVKDRVGRSPRVHCEAVFIRAATLESFIRE